MDHCDAGDIGCGYDEDEGGGALDDYESAEVGGLFSEGVHAAEHSVRSGAAWLHKHATHLNHLIHSIDSKDAIKHIGKAAGGVAKAAKAYAKEHGLMSVELSTDKINDSQTTLGAINDHLHQEMHTTGFDGMRKQANALHATIHHAMNGVSLAETMDKIGQDHHVKKHHHNAHVKLHNALSAPAVHKPTAGAIYISQIATSAASLTHAFATELKHKP